MYARVNVVNQPNDSRSIRCLIAPDKETATAEPGQIFAHNVYDLFRPTPADLPRMQIAEK